MKLAETYRITLTPEEIERISDLGEPGISIELPAIQGGREMYRELVIDVDPEKAAERELADERETLNQP